MFLITVGFRSSIRYVSPGFEVDFRPEGGGACPGIDAWGGGDNFSKAKEHAMRHKGLVIGLLGLCLVFLAVPAWAASAWYVCEIHSVGVDDPSAAYTDGAYAFCLTDTGGAFTNSCFYKPRTQYNDALLAVFLTAASSGVKVKVYLDPADSASLTQVNLWPH
jgi:hypothetical protein